MVYRGLLRVYGGSTTIHARCLEGLQRVTGSYGPLMGLQEMIQDEGQADPCDYLKHSTTI